MNIAAPCARVFVLILILSVIALTIPLGVRAQEQIVAGYDGHAGFQGPFGRKRSGPFDKYGLTAELVLIPGSARGMAALLSGSVQFAQVRHRAAVGLFARRRRCGGGCRLEQVFSVIARKEIRQPSDLIGKKIGIVNFGGSNDLAVTLAFKEWNIPRSAATILASGGAPERLAALMTGTLDATVLSPWRPWPPRGQG